MSQFSLRYSTDLMQNYLEADTMDPPAKFLAAEAQTGTALLFSLGTDQVFYVTKEQAGSEYGWSRHDLSSAQIARDFSGQHGVVCKDFAVAEPAAAGSMSIRLAMVLTDGEHSDHLYLALDRSAADLSWIENPGWLSYPFDDPNHHLSQVRIVGVFLSQATDGNYIAVDVLRDPVSAEPLIFRYYLDVNKAGGYAWHAHDVAIDLESGAYSSCLGRKAGGLVDGIYTAGRVTGFSQFQYQPLYNAFNPNLPAPPDLLHLPGDAIPEAIAACRNFDNTSDLYACANGTLYYFASTNQGNNATAKPVLVNPVLRGVRTLFATVDGDRVLIWGLNGNDQVFYTTCAIASLNTVNPPFTVPIPILSGVEQVAPYLNHAESANTFFAHTGQNQLTRAVKSPATTLWTFQQIALPPLTQGPNATQRFKAYTTQVQILDGQGQPAAGTMVSVRADDVLGVYINNLYYVVSPTAIDVKTDALGRLTVIEAVTSVAGTQLTITVGDTETRINPMDRAFHRLTELTTPASLQAATIVYPDGQRKPLLPPGVPNDQLQAVAAANQQLNQAYASVLSPQLRRRRTSPGLATVALSGLDSIWVEAGDLFAWLADKVDYVISLVKDAATGLWHFVVSLAGHTYACVLDAVEKVVAAAQWLYLEIKTALDDLLQFLAFLFEWPDIRRTKEVLKNLIRLYLTDQVNQIEVFKQAFDGQIDQLKTTLDTLLQVTDWSGLGPAGQATTGQTSTPAADQSAPGSLLMHHYTYNAQNSMPLGPVTTPAPPAGVIAVLVNAVNQEEAALNHVVEKLRALGNNVASMSLTDVLKSVLDILADAALDSAKVVVDALLDLLYNLALGALAVLDQPIYVPVVSDILADVGVPPLSFLDIACWLTALPMTVAYKAINGHAPFPDDQETAFLIQATDFTAVLSAFSRTAPDSLQRPSGVDVPPTVGAMATPAAAWSLGAASSGVLSLSTEMRHAVHIIGHGVSGFTSLMSAIVSGFEAAEESAENPWSKPSSALGILGGVAGGLANVLVPYDAVENSVVSWISRVTTTLRILNKVGFWAASSKFSDPRKYSSIVDAALIIPGLGVSGWHFYELSQQPAGSARSIAIVDETSALTNDIARASYTVAVNSEAEVKLAAIAVHVIANVLTGGLQIAESAIPQP